LNTVYILSCFNPVILKREHAMKRLLSVCIMLGSAFVLGQTNSDQDSSSVAVIEFTSTGISDLETQTLSNYFFSELEKATDKQFMNPSRIKDKISDLEMGKSDCYTKECLQGGLDALGVQQLLVGTVKYSKNKYRVKVKMLDAAKPNKPKSFSFRYKGDADGFITELEILAWEVMGAQTPDRLLGKRKPNQESMFEKIAENPWSKRVLLLSVAGMSGASYVSNMSAYQKSKDRANTMSDYKPGYDGHMKSADKSKNEATLSAVVLIGVLVYGYFDGAFTGDDSD